MTIKNIQLRTGRTFPGKSAAPAVTDDGNDGYLIGDIWVDETNDKSYMIFDITVGAAVWVELTGGGGHTTEEIQDIIGAMLTGNTETNITVTYQDGDGTIDFEVTGGSGGDKYPMEARLTLETGVAISTTDQLAKTTLYLTKYKGDQVAIYDGASAWSVIALTSDLSITLASLTASLPYDVYVYSNAGTLTLELTAWTNATTRATALTTQNGIYVKTGATTRRYLGTILITAVTGQCEDSAKNRLIFNYYNRVKRKLAMYDTTDQWTYDTATLRPWNNSTANRISVMYAVAEEPIHIMFAGLVYHPGGNNLRLGIGLDSTTAHAAGTLHFPTPSGSSLAIYEDTPAIGSHYFQALEIGNGATSYFFGDNGGADAGGMTGHIFA